VGTLAYTLAEADALAASPNAGRLLLGYMKVFDPAVVAFVQGLTIIGGLVGSVIAHDLASTHDVTAVDRRADRLREVFVGIPVKTLVADVGDPAVVTRLVSAFDLVVDAVPGHLGRQTLGAVIAARKPVVDIAFFPEDPFDLDAAAREAGVTAIVDFGVAPGLSNLIAGHWQARFDEFERFECFVGGLPARPEPPFEYRAVFSPIDVIGISPISSSSGVVKNTMFVG